MELIPDVRWVPVRTAAKILGVSASRVYKLLEEHKLVGRRLDGIVLVHMHGVELRHQEQQKGRCEDVSGR